MTAYDVLVVGGGVQGLWLAREAIAAGLQVGLVEAEVCGAGASGGLLGALMPHVPTGWSEKKQFQFLGLMKLAMEVEALRQETGIDTGYVRSGRIMPIRQQGFLDQFASRRAASWLYWQTKDVRFELDMLEPNRFPGWLDPDQAKLGVFWDPLAAKIDPQRYIAALKASIGGRCDIHEAWHFANYDVASGRVTSANGGEHLVAKNVIIAAGYQSYEIARRLTGLELGAGVKGQAVMLEVELPTECPIIFDDGMYIVAHGKDRCAVGSTTEELWDDARSTDDALDGKVKHARQLCPALRNAPVVSAWAGVRPQSSARDPIAGQLLPECPIHIATGGFKITLGIAHMVADSLIAGLVRGRPASGMPATFSPEVHLAAAKRAAAIQASDMSGNRQ